jgi:hypothetical protein
MTNRGRLVYSALALLAGALPLNSALATCTGATKAHAVWHFHGIEAKNNGGADAIRCVATFGAGGNFTGPCTNYTSGSSAPQSVNVSGKITVNAACDFTGSITIPGDKPVGIKFGHINGNIGSGVGTQDTGTKTRVLHITLIKK